jgi:hypothetical protein
LPAGYAGLPPSQHVSHNVPQRAQKRFSFLSMYLSDAQSGQHSPVTAQRVSVRTSVAVGCIMVVIVRPFSLS